MTNNGLQNITRKTKHRATQTPQKPGVTLAVLQKSGSSCSTSGTYPVTLVTMISHEWGKGRIVIKKTESIHGHLWHRYRDR